MIIDQKLEILRYKMKEKGIYAYIIPSTDPHLNEYVPSYYKAREWISGFTGSAGIVVVTFDKAILWTDGRYYIQAAKQIQNTEFELYKMEKNVPNYMDFIEQTLLEGQVVGFDGRNFSCADALNLKNFLANKKIRIECDIDIIGEMWIEDRPPIPMKKVFIHDINFAGYTVKQKFEQILVEIEKNHVDYYLVSALDSIAWFLNIRGDDIPYVPVVISYLLISKDSITWFVNSDKLTPDIKIYLRENDIITKDYKEIFNELKKISSDKKVFMDKTKTSYAIYSAVKNAEVIGKGDIISRLKAIKNPIEIKNIKETHIKDGVAMVNFLYWLDKNIGTNEVTELDIAEKLVEYRLEQEDCLGPSFETIAGYNENAAMMHYIATENNYTTLNSQGMLLVDSGGQYISGTTDITRTIVLNEVTEEQKRDFTLVLKANIAMVTSIFLEGSTGKTLDVIARKHLWNYYLNYKCGSGHGIGYCLNVHEGPHGFGVDIPFEPGMIITIEPGIYKEGRYGIRTENTLLVVRDGFKDGVGQFYRFEMLTYCPIDIRAIDISLLNKAEIDWINSYHEIVYGVLSPFLGTKQRSWLKKMTVNIGGM